MSGRDESAGQTSGSDQEMEPAGSSSGAPEPVDRRSTRLGSGLALAAGAVAATASVDAPAALGVCLGGLLVLGVGLAATRQSLVTAGGALLVAGPLAAAATGAPPVLATLVGVTAAILAFDLGSTAVSLGEQLGHDAPTAQVELVHAGASTVVGLSFVLVGFAVHEMAATGQPTSAVVGLVVAVVVLLVALRRADPRGQ